ncbi:MAG: PAC2 family protein [Bifidobacteriaceae bacterium]|jgi:hypothetical protein|nr:PAC2 family protein [Bifidobacteriaceae bacterium]
MQEELYTIHREVAEGLESWGEPPRLLYAFDGFVDAGVVAGLAINDLVTHGDAQRLVSFRTDDLLDYRSRRPPMSYGPNGWLGVSQPDLGIDVVHDAEGAPLLLMYGPEPDFKWEAFAGAMVDLADHFDIGHAIGMHGIPVPVPHTRPWRVSGPGQPESLVKELTGHEGRIHLPGSAMGLVEIKLKENGRQASTYSLQVPAYLASTPCPGGAAQLLRVIGGVTGLNFELGRLIKAGAEARAQIDQQVASSPDLVDAVRRMEDRYDQALQRRAAGELEAEALPTGDELAAEFEKYLAALGETDQADGQDGQDGQGGPNGQDGPAGPEFS